MLRYNKLAYPPPPPPSVEINETNVIDFTFLDNTYNIATQVVAAIRAVSPTVEIWAGEVGPHNGDGGPGEIPVRIANCSGNLVCGRFGSTIWYADAMSSKARAGYAAFCRQDFIGADYGLMNFTSHAPSTDYWLLTLWQRLVGPRVLTISTPPSDPRVRVTAFCSPKNGTVTLLIINLAPSSICLAPPGFADGITPRVEYGLTPTDGSVTSSYIDLNGVQLVFGPGGAMPLMPGVPVDASAPINLPPLSVTFVEIFTNADACMA